MAWSDLLGGDVGGLEGISRDLVQAHATIERVRSGLASVNGQDWVRGRYGSSFQSYVDETTRGGLARALAHLDELDNTLLTYVQAQIELSNGAARPAQQGLPYPGGLGPPVNGESVPRPGVPAAPGDDAGSGPHGAERPTLGDRASEAAIATAATAVGVRWPNASANMLHYLANSGADRAMDVNAMLRDLPGLRGAVDERMQAMENAAIARAQQMGATAAVTFPISTQWEVHNGSTGTRAAQDWYYALGDFSYSIQGEITVYPPSTPDGQWHYATDRVVSVADRYNWDRGLSAEVFGIEIEDETLGRLHTVGLAQEFDIVGTSANLHRVTRS